MNTEKANTEGSLVCLRIACFFRACTDTSLGYPPLDGRTDGLGNSFLLLSEAHDDAMSVYFSRRVRRLYKCSSSPRDFF
jgi:hypothetical protein